MINQAFATFMGTSGRVQLDGSPRWMYWVSVCFQAFVFPALVIASMRYFDSVSEWAFDQESVQVDPHAALFAYFSKDFFFGLSRMMKVHHAFSMAVTLLSVTLFDSFASNCFLLFVLTMEVGGLANNLDMLLPKLNLDAVAYALVTLSHLTASCIAISYAVRAPDLSEGARGFWLACAVTMLSIRHVVTRRRANAAYRTRVSSLAEKLAGYANPAENSDVQIPLIGRGEKED